MFSNVLNDNLATMLDCSKDKKSYNNYPPVKTKTDDALVMKVVTAMRLDIPFKWDNSMLMHIATGT